jgi:hypothetical protein
LKRAFEFGTADVGAEKGGKRQYGSDQKKRVQPAHEAHLVWMRPSKDAGDELRELTNSERTVPNASSPNSRQCTRCQSQPQPRRISSIGGAVPASMCPCCAGTVIGAA